MSTCFDIPSVRLPHTTDTHCKEMDDRNFDRNTSFWIPVKGKKRLHYTRKSKAKSKVTFQESFRGTLFIGQILSLIPIVGIFSNNVDVRFVLTSWKCVYALLSFLGQFFISIMTIYNLIATETTLTAMTFLIFYATTCIIMALFFKIAISWPNLIQDTAYVEELDPSYDNKLRTKCNVTSVIVMSFSFVDHILLLVKMFIYSSICYSTYPIYEGIARNLNSEIFNVIPYSPILGIIIQFFDTQATFIWNYISIFVICVSYYLISRLNHVNKKLLAVQGKCQPEIFWRRRREEFGRTIQLVRKFGELMSGIILIIFANSLYYICLQLFYALNLNDFKYTVECTNNEYNTTYRYVASVYFWFSLVHLIVKFMTVSLALSEVHTASLVPAGVLYDVPSASYCVEVQRFLQQVVCDEVALTGLQFFSVTRGLLLNIVGTIISYELIMFQFIPSHSPGNSTEASNFTNSSLF